MFKVQVADRIEVFSTHAEAVRFIVAARRLRVVCKLLTKLEVSPKGNLGGYAGVNALRPVHCLG